MDIPENLFYSKDHEWLKIIDKNCHIGITEYAQSELGDIVFMELPEIGLKISKGDSIATIEAVKTVADVYAPISGEIININSSLENSPELLNSDPYGEGWIVVIKSEDPIVHSDYLTSSNYKNLIGK